MAGAPVDGSPSKSNTCAASVCTEVLRTVKRRSIGKLCAEVSLVRISAGMFCSESLSKESEIRLV
jgi:hypothetical protein